MHMSFGKQLGLGGALAARTPHMHTHERRFVDGCTQALADAGEPIHARSTKLPNLAEQLCSHAITQAYVLLLTSKRRKAHCSLWAKAHCHPLHY
eukprot:1157210-Pelagomonas_calceolata.AAC.12